MRRIVLGVAMLAAAVSGSGCCSVAGNLWLQNRDAREGIVQLQARNGGVLAGVDVAALLDTRAMQTAGNHPWWTTFFGAADTGIGLVLKNFWSQYEDAEDEKDDPPPAQAKDGGTSVQLNNSNNNEIYIIRDGSGNAQGTSEEEVAE